MILGDRCTRRCSFCAVSTAKPAGVDEEEPKRLAQAVSQLKLRYVVVTSVARDDLEDEGSEIFALCVAEIKKVSPQTQVEVLTPDFHGKEKLIEQVVSSKPEVFSHNLETVRRFSKALRPQADYERSLSVLRTAKRCGGAGSKTKSGLMMGLGERREEVRQALVDLRKVGCDIVTIGQYLQPTPWHPAASDFVSPEGFESYRLLAKELGFSFVASGPFVRSSYNAFEALENKE
jgi:lipoic acid synthetase